MWVGILSENWAWSSQKRSLQFAFELSKVRISDELLSGPDDQPANNSRARLEKLLNLIEDYSPASFATLWKHKSRGECISAVARSRSYTPAADHRENRTEFVCKTPGTHAKLIVQGSKPIPECSIPFLREWECHDIRELPEDFHWNTRKRISSEDLVHQYALTFDGFCNRLPRPKNDDVSVRDHQVDFILNIYIDHNCNSRQCQAAEQHGKTGTQCTARS